MASIAISRSNWLRTQMIGRKERECAAWWLNIGFFKYWLQPLGIQFQEIAHCCREIYEDVFKVGICQDILRFQSVCIHLD